MNYGMTNHSEVINIEGKKYLVRTPGEGTDKLINRKQEKYIYSVIKDLHISDDVVYINADTGVKITKFIEDTHNCNKYNFDEVKKCMLFLKHNLHEKKLKVNYIFDFKERITYYLSLCSCKSDYKDFDEVYDNINKLLTWINTFSIYDINFTLTHIDAIPDNFLIDKQGNITLLDWEYAAMQDAHVDIVMFAIYAGYNKHQIDNLIDTYFENDIVTLKIRMKIYAYVAICGFLWYTWCMFKAEKGVTYGNYAETQYNYAKTFSHYVLVYANMYKARPIQNAIILAAGKGTRLGALTAITAKPLVKINNKPIIEYTIEALQNKAINDITIVVGYKAEQFEYLKHKYGVSLIYNSFYESSNNIVSLFLASDKLSDTIILDADQIVNEAAIPTAFNYSHYGYQNIKGPTKEWVMQFYDDSSIISQIDVSKATKHGCALKSYSIWLKEESVRLKQFITTEVLKGNVNIYWDNVPCELYFDEFYLRGYELKSSDLYEIDTTKDLCIAKEALK